MSPWPGGFHSESGSMGHSTGLKSSFRTLGNLCCKKDRGISENRLGYLLRNFILSSCVLKLFMSTRGIFITCFSLWLRICLAIISRKFNPSFTSIRDLAFDRPILVPRPPFNFIITALLITRHPSSVNLSNISTSAISSFPIGTISSLDINPLSPVTSFS